MSFSISWTDFPEEADKDEVLADFSIRKVWKNNEDGQRELDSDINSILDEGFLSDYSVISGDNYPVLRLIEKTYAEKIDLIYIDPPYNTGKKDFVYDDDFSTRISTKENGSSVDFHSKWLSFMSRRLKCAKNLLSEEGCIFIAIGKEELFHLKLLCDMIFGEENFVNDFMWLCGKGKKDKFSRTMQQSTLCYAKNIKKLGAFTEFQTSDWAKTNPDNDPRGPWFSGSISFSEGRSNPAHPNYYQIVSPSGKKWCRQWLITKQEMDELLKDNRIYWGSAPEYSNVPRSKVFNGQKTEIIPKNIIEGAGDSGVGTTRDAQNYLDKLLGEKCVFDNPKPVALLEHLISICAMKENITVLDFFAGSGTTLEAVYNLNQKDGGNRRCILVQKPEKIDGKESRFSTVSELCLERCRKVCPETEEYKLVKE